MFLDRIKGALTRETSGGSLIPHVDGLRFFAVMSVMLFHLNGYVATKISHPRIAGGADLAAGSEAGSVGGSAAAADTLASDPVWRVLSSGYFGVQLFFVISGFILGMPFAKAWFTGSPRPSLGKYLLRRVTRLEPPYVICLCVSAVFFVVMRHEPVFEVAKHLGASLLYAHYFIYGTPSTINGVAWSLEIEVQFYLLAPLLGLLFAIRHRWLRRGVLAALIAGFALGQSLTHFDCEHGDTLLHEAHYFLCGFLLVDFYLNEWTNSEASRREAFLWDASGLAAWGLIVVTLARWTPLFTTQGQIEARPRHQELAHLPLACMVLVAYAAAFRGRWWRTLLSQPLLYIIGGMCYTIYLWHSLLVSIFGRVALRLVHSESHIVNVAISVLIVVPPVLLVSSVFFVLFEKPFMRRDWFQRTMAAIGLR